MKPFELVTPSSLAEARDVLQHRGADAVVYAGGTDLLGEIKEGTASPTTLVSLGRLPDLSAIEVTDAGVVIGSMVTLAEIERSLEISDRYPALTQAAASVATPQIRNAATLGGNLCQRPRCWYYRSPRFDCLKKGGDVCHAIEGSNKYHAILGADRCYIVHPSDTAVALAALGASVEVSGGAVVRHVPILDLFAHPGQNMLSETVLGPGEIVTRVLIPAPSALSRSIYLKVKERQAYDFALASVGAFVEFDGGRVSRSRFVLGGVAPVPYPLPAVSHEIDGADPAEIDPSALGQIAVRDARPMSDNGFKVHLASNLVARSVRALLGGWTG